MFMSCGASSFLFTLLNCCKFWKKKFLKLLSCIKKGGLAGCLLFTFRVSGKWINSRFLWQVCVSLGEMRKQPRIHQPLRTCSEMLSLELERLLAGTTSTIRGEKQRERERKTNTKFGRQVFKFWNQSYSFIITNPGLRFEEKDLACVVRFCVFCLSSFFLNVKFIINFLNRFWTEQTKKRIRNTILLRILLSSGNSGG